MIDIILMTALMRPENLDRMLDSVYDAFGKNYQARGYNITWCIAKDKYNCKDVNNLLPEFYEKLKNNHFKFYSFECGFPNQNNYGGDIFNKVLEFLFKHAEGDPYIYIFDDDNIIHPLIPVMIRKLDTAYGGAKGAWFSHIAENGNVHESFAWTAFQGIPIENGESFMISTPDPSSVVLKLSAYKEFFPVGNGFGYDYWWLKNAARTLYEKHELILMYDLENGGRYSAYHNGLRKSSEISHYLMNPDDTCMDIILQDKSNSVNEKRWLVPVPKDAVPEVIEVIKKYIK